MTKTCTFYMDETGNRHPDKKAGASRINKDWFAFGGVIVRSEDAENMKQSVRDFGSRWRLRTPAHITDMLAQKKGFAWLGTRSQEDVEKFWDDWRRVLCESPAIGLGCVIDRPGYVKRGYLESYNDKWLLCRSAFDIAVERAAKIARLEDRKLHIVFESDPAMNDKVKSYFQNLKTKGLAFDGERSNRYAPLTKEQFTETLGRIDHKPKEHPILQIADSYIYAIARHKYEQRYWLWRHLRDRKRIADFAVPDGMSKTLGVKHYCFD